MAVPFADLFALPIPEGITDEEAVLLTDILPTGYPRVLRADIDSGDDGGRRGPGSGRDHALQRASLFGPARILAIDVAPERLARARSPRSRTDRLTP